MSNHYRITQYSCAVFLIITSVLLATWQVVTIDDLANGLLIYIAQSFMLAGSIFGLDYYVRKISNIIQNGSSSKTDSR